MMAFSTIEHVIMSSQHNLTVYDIMKDLQFTSMNCMLTGPG